MAEVIKIVLTGGPCSGKTTALSYVSKKLREQGIEVITIEERATKLILSGKTGWGAMGYGAIGILLAASYVGSGVSCRLIMHRKLLVCILSGIIYLCSLAAITALLFGGKYEGIWLSALLVAGGVGASALVHCAEKRDGGRRRKKRRL